MNPKSNPALHGDDSESGDERVVRLLREAHAAAEAGDFEAAMELSTAAYEEHYGEPRP